MEDYNGVFGRQVIQIRQTSMSGKCIKGRAVSSDAVILGKEKQQDKRSLLKKEINAVLHVPVFVYCRGEFSERHAYDYRRLMLPFGIKGGPTGNIPRWSLFKRTTWTLPSSETKMI